MLFCIFLSLLNCIETFKWHRNSFIFVPMIHTIHETLPRHYFDFSTASRRYLVCKSIVKYKSLRAKGLILKASHLFELFDVFFFLLEKIPRQSCSGFSVETKTLNQRKSVVKPQVEILDSIFPGSLFTHNY